jgi:ribonuclease HII
MIGIDEVGRGCWAGPLLVVAARNRPNIEHYQYRDSKVVSRQQREKLYDLISQSFDLGEGWVSPQEIDALGLSRAMTIGVERALANVDATNDEEIVIDGNINFCPKEFTNAKSMIKADNKINNVSAASIYAKVTRDRFMAEKAKKYSGYDFENNVGYGTRKHASAIQTIGVCDLHRKSYKPIARILNAQ